MQFHVQSKLILGVNLRCVIKMHVHDNKWPYIHNLITVAKAAQQTKQSKTTVTKQAVLYGGYLCDFRHVISTNPEQTAFLKSEI